MAHRIYVYNVSKNGKEKENLQEKDKPQQVQPPLDKNALQAFFDASYHLSLIHI